MGSHVYVYTSACPVFLPPSGSVSRLSPPPGMPFLPLFFAKTSLSFKSWLRNHFFQDVSSNLHRLENLSWFNFGSSAFLSNSSTAVCLGSSIV